MIHLLRQVAAEYIKERGVEKLYHFFMGFDYENFGVIGSQKLNCDPLPSLSKVYFIVTQKERQSGR